MGKKLYKRLLQLGAQPIVERGDGNDQDFLGVDQALDPWLQSLWVNLMDLFPLAHGLTVLPDSTLPPPSFTFKFITQGETVEKSSITSYGAEISAVAATLLVNQRLTHQDHFQDTRHLVFKLPDNDIHQDDDGSSDNKNGSISICYNPGDVLSVRPQNLAEDVDKFIDFFGWKDDLVDKPFLIVPNITGEQG